MRVHGTLSKWNDDRGFGFITPAKGDRDIFVHISEFPRDGVRPRVDELISFEVEISPDGKRRAVRVMRPNRPAPRGPSIGRRPSQARRRWLDASISLAVVAAIGVYAMHQFESRSTAKEAPRSSPIREVADTDSKYACDGRTHCSEMRSCDEATWFIRHCPNTKMDGNGDGVPCETQWCN